MLKSKTKKLLLTVLLCLCAVLFAPLLGLFSSVYAYTSLPSGSIGNIFDETKGANGTFSKGNLDALAQKAGFNNLASMIKYIEDGGAPKNAVDFGHSTVKFGKSYGGEGDGAEEFVWIPAYLSQSSVDSNGDGTGDVVLTLWLAYNSHTSVYHESYSGDNVQPSSNNYSTSITRTEVLNNTGVYYTGYGDGKTPNLKAVNYTATAEKTHMFQMYTTGVLKDYIVEPSNVSWQTGPGSNRMKNDPGWKGYTDGYYFQDKDGNEQTWVNDKLWLPSIYEMYDGSVAANSKLAAPELKTTAGVADVNAAGLWGTNANERKCTNNTYVRTGYPTNYKWGYSIGSTGNGTYTRIAINSYICAVRPALHLNLSKIGECQHNLVNHPAVSYCDKEGYEEYWQCTECDSMFSDSEGKNAIDAPVKVNPTGHDYPDEWITNATNHWHVCTKGCGIKGSDGAHSGGTATCQQKATCSVCGQIYGDYGSHDLEHHEAKTPTCTEKGWSAYDTCKLCDYTTYAEIKENGHTPSDWIVDKEATCSEAGSKHKECTVCHTSLETGTIDKIVHTSSDWIEDKAPTCTATGSKHKECTVCHNTLESANIDKIAHASGAAATCTTAQTCTVCGTEVAPKLGHKYEAVEGGGTPPTCTEAGNGKVKCSRCGDEKVGDSIPATGHTQGIAATCTEPQTCTICGTELAAALGHDFGEWETTKEATFTEDGEKKRECSRCDEFETEVIPKKEMGENGLTLELATSFAYGDEISPVVSAQQGEIVLKWYDTATGEELAEKPSTVGSYKLVAKVEEDLEAGCKGVEKEVEFTISKREITVTINAGSSEQGKDLEELTATVTSGSIVGEIPYTLSTDADKETMGDYVITGTCTNDNYNITFVDGVYIVSKKEEDPDGNGEIDLPVDINVEFKVTQSETSSDYSELKGLKTGYWAQLWYRNDDGTLGDEFTDKMNCILTLKIPTDIIEAIRGGEEINRDKIAEGLKVYYVNGDGEFVGVENFIIAQKEDESWIVKFNYNEKFRAEVVFNAEGVEEPAPEEPEEPKEGIPWLVWLIVGIGVVVVITLIVVIAIAVKKKGGSTPTDNGEVIQRLDNQDQILNEILNRGDDGGFNTPVELDENGNVIFK